MAYPYLDSTYYPLIVRQFAQRAIEVVKRSA
jgi:hypothetical protein